MTLRFKEYVTSTAFHLTLSRGMIEALCFIDQNGWCVCSFHTLRALEARGLIEAVKWSNEFFYKPKLTEAGQAVIPLLKIAGLYIKAPECDEDVSALGPPKITIKTNPAQGGDK